MIVTINQKEVNIKVTSLIIEPNREQPEIMKAFFCSDCGKPVFQYNGNIVLEVPGRNEVAIPIIIRCATCKKRYLLCSRL